MLEWWLWASGQSASSVHVACRNREHSRADASWWCASDITSRQGNHERKMWEMVQSPTCLEPSLHLLHTILDIYATRSRTSKVRNKPCQAFFRGTLDSGMHKRTAIAASTRGKRRNTPPCRQRVAEYSIPIFLHTTLAILTTRVHAGIFTKWTNL